MEFFEIESSKRLDNKIKIFEVQVSVVNTAGR